MCILPAGIVELHQGKIGAYSDGEGTGTTFYVRIPIYSRQAQSVGEKQVSFFWPSKASSSNHSSSINSSTLPEPRKNSNPTLFSMFSSGESKTGNSGGTYTQPKRPSQGFARSVRTVMKDMDLPTASPTRKAMLKRNSSASMRVSPRLREDPAFEEVLPTKTFVRRNSDPSLSGKGELITPFIPPRGGLMASVKENLRDSDSEYSAGPNDGRLSPVRENDRSSAEGDLSVATLMSLEMKAAEITLSPDVTVQPTVAAFGVSKSPSLTPYFMLVDDSKMSRSIVRRILVSKGNSVSEADDGQHLIDLMEETFKTHKHTTESTSKSDGIWYKELFPFNVILMDDNMPRKSGQNTTKYLREKGYNGLIIGTYVTYILPLFSGFILF